MNRRIEYLDNLTVDLHTIRYVDRLLENAADCFGNARLAVARRTVKKDGPAGIYRRPQSFDELLRQNQIGKALQ